MLLFACLWLFQDATAHAESGLRKFRQGDYEGAAADYSKAIELDPKDANYRAMRAQIHEKRKDFDSAIRDYTALAELTGDAFAWIQKRAEARASQNDFKGAVADYSLAIESAKKGQAGLEKAFAYRGWYQLKSENPEAAIADYTRAIELEPQNPNHYNNRGNAFRALDRPKEATADFSRAIGINPEFAHPYHNRGLCRLDLGDFDGAIADQTKAIELKPSYVDAFYNRGLARQEKGDLKGAIDDFTQVRALDPRNVSALVDRGECKRKLGDFKGAIADQAEAARSGDLDAWEAKGYAEYESGAWEEALASFRKVRDRDRCRWRIWAILMRLGKKEEARREVQKAEDAISKFLAGTLTAEELLEQSKDDACRAHFYIGMHGLLAAGDKERARVAFERCRGAADRPIPESTSAAIELERLK